VVDCGPACEPQKSGGQLLGITAVPPLEQGGGRPLGALHSGVAARWAVFLPWVSIRTCRARSTCMRARSFFPHVLRQASAISHEMRRGLRLLPAQLAHRLAIGGGTDRQCWGSEAGVGTCHVGELLQEGRDFTGRDDLPYLLRSAWRTRPDVYLEATSVREVLL
jgi:hypothetical protein